MSHPFDGGADYRPEGSQQYSNQMASAQPGPLPLAPGKFDALESLTQAWRVFTEKPWSWLLSGAIYLAIFMVCYLGGYFYFTISIAMMGEEADSMPIAPLVSFIVALLIGCIALFLWSVITYRESALALTGKRPELGDFFTFRRVGILIVASLILGVLSLLGFLVFIIGTFVVSFFLSFFLPAVAVGGIGIGDAFKSGYQVVRANMGQTFLLFIMNLVVGSSGGVMGLGSLLFVPLLALAHVHAYLRATGRPMEYRAPRY